MGVLPYRNMSLCYLKLFNCNRLRPVALFIPTFMSFYTWSRTNLIKTRSSLRSLFLCMVPKQNTVQPLVHQCIGLGERLGLRAHWHNVVLIWQFNSSFSIVPHNTIEFDYISSVLCIHVRATRPRTSSGTCKQQAATPPTTTHLSLIFCILH